MLLKFVFSANSTKQTKLNRVLKTSAITVVENKLQRVRVHLVYQLYFSDQDGVRQIIKFEMYAHTLNDSEMR